jgi:hypothetical protein
MRRLLTIAVLAGLSGCAGGPAVEQDTAAGVELRWYNTESDIHQATAEAEAHCEAEGRRAELQRLFIDRDVTLARFGCR